MNWMARTFASAIVRKLAYVLVAFALLGIGKCAHAAEDTSHCNDVNERSAYCETDAQAKAAAHDMAAQFSAQNPSFPVVCDAFIDPSTGAWASKAGWYGGNKANCGTNLDGWYFLRYWNRTDPCAGKPSDPFHPGECVTPDKCLAGNTDTTSPYYLGADRSRTWTGPSHCAGGCMMALDNSTKKPNSTYYDASGVQQQATIFAGEARYTGVVQDCSAPLPGESTPPPTETVEKAKAPPKEECVHISGQTACKQADGKTCAEGAYSRRYCWEPFSTGTKTDQDTVQVKKPGTSPGDASMALPNGDVANKTAEMQIKDVDENTGRTATTTLSTYKTASGANAGPVNQGSASPPAGSTSTSPDNTPDSEKGDKNGSTGGTDCSSPPVSTGDAILAQIAFQTWQTRCNAERADKAQVDYKAQLEGSMPPDEDGSKLWQNGSDSGSLDEGLVSLGGGQCPDPPALSVEGQTFAWPPGFCDALAAIRLLVIGIALVWGAGILAGKE